MTTLYTIHKVDKTKLAAVIADMRVLGFPTIRAVDCGGYLMAIEGTHRVAAAAHLGLTLADFDVVELNEAFASQCLATLRDLGLTDDDPRVNPNGGAIALGHPLGMSGARIAGTAALELSLTGGRWSLSAMCIGVGQGIALALERV